MEKSKQRDRHACYIRRNSRMPRHDDKAYLLAAAIMSYGKRTWADSMSAV